MHIKQSYKIIKRSIKPAFTDDLWNTDLTEISNKAKRRFFKFMKLSRFTVTEFAEQRMGFQCVALSYSGVFAMIPLLAFIFFVTDGLGLSDKIYDLTHTYLQASPELIDLVLEKANMILTTAQSGWVGVISAAMFIWTIFWLLFQIERVFNNIWGIRKIGRKLYKRFSAYLIMIILIPFVILIFGAGIAAYSNIFDIAAFQIRDFRVVKTIISWLLMCVIAIFTISLMFKYIPKPEVRYSYALKSAIVTGIAFTVFQYLYIETQLFVTRLSAVYGVLAAIPLYMTWMNFSWQIIMYGCMLCRAYHNADDYNIED